MHRKITEMPREWPLARKGKKYLARASDRSIDSLPILFALRDILGVVQTKREARKVCLNGDIKINGIIRKDEQFPLKLRDVLEIEKMKKTYVLRQKGKRFVLEEENINSKISKIIGKRILSGKKIQANLDDGTNKILKDKFSRGDSLVVEFGKKDSIKIIPLGKNSKVEIIGGKHIGKVGMVVGTEMEKEKEVFKIKLDKEKEILLREEFLLAI